MSGHRASHCLGDDRPVPSSLMLKEVERMGPRAYKDPRTGHEYEVVWDGAGPLPGHQEWPRRHVHHPLWYALMY